MEFRILGPLELVADGEPVPLRGQRQRALLALLLVHANEVVAEDTLLDELWGGEPPASGAAALRVRVSQLRKALPGVTLARRASGYALELGPDALDAALFERLLARGIRERGEGALEAAVETLRAATALWRGPPLADFAYEEFARAEIGRLEELRVRAHEERLEAELGLGRDADLVGELEALAAANPLRERVRGQLMLALYRAGRQAEALAAYRETRRVLVDELGLEPSEELQELERAILRHDPALESPRVPDLPAPAPVPPADAERKLVTVLVAELGASPVLRGDPERADASLERLREQLAAEVETAGGRVEAFAGGALTAVFGAPVAQEDHAERALHAALALRRRLEEGFGDEVSLRIGVATGDAVVGEGRTTVGRPVAGAMRFAHAAPPGAVCVGRRAAATARGAFEFGALEDAYGCRYLLRALSVTSARGGGTALVGRGDELDALRAAYRRVVRDRRPHFASVVGDAGVGKSRLVRELWDVLPAETPSPLRRSGRCHSYGHGTTYRPPLAEVLREELGVLETDPPETVLERLRGREILGLTLGLDVAPDLHPLEARARLRDGWIELLTVLASARPVVLLIEDLHWAQEGLLDLLERLVDEVRGPLLVVGTARPELLAARPAWGRRRDATGIWLEPLADDDAGRMLDAAAAWLPDELRGPVLERAEGNPFFLEELLASLVGPTVAEPRIPDSIQAVLAARIDLLPPTEKAALQAAAVIGRSFWRGPVRVLLQGEAPDFALLESRDFIRRRSSSSLAGEREFAFKHALTRDVAYASLSKASRARLHAAFARWLEAVAEGRGEHAALLAHHYAEAVRPEDADLAWAHDEDELARLRERTSAWLRRAAEIGVRRYDLDEALALLERALSLDPDERTALELWKLVGRANALKHDGEPFLAAMTRALELSTEQETTAELYADLSFETALRAGMWRQRPSRELVDGWIDRALELAAPDSAARARALIARCVWNPVGSPTFAPEASAIAERLGDPELRSYAWDARGITAWVAGEPDLGRAWEERRFELIDQISDPDHVADIYYAPVTGCVWLGYFGEARRLARRHDEITSPLTDHHRIHGLAVLVEVEELAGCWERIRELEERTDVTILANRETPCVRSPRSLLVCALARFHLGETARASFLEECADEFEMTGYGHVLDTPRLMLALVRGDLALAERILAVPLPDRGWHRAWLLLSSLAARLDAFAALGRRAEVEAWQRQRRNTYLEPFHLRALGIVREDDALIEQALAGFEALRLDWHAARTRALLV